MTSQRITAAIREAILEAAVERKCGDDMRALQKRSAALDKRRDKIYDEGYKTAFTRAHLALIKKLPEGWLSQCSSVRVQVEGNPDDTPNITKISFGTSRPVPEKFTGYDGMITRTVPADAPYFKLYADWQEDKAAWVLDDTAMTADKRELRAKVRAVINSVTTTGRLIDVWPECVDLLPKGSIKSGAMLPAIVIGDLNKELDLTPKKVTQRDG